MLTFGQAKQSNITTICGVTPESDAFKGYINEAMERLMYRGDFDGLLAIGCFCVRRGCVVFPRYVDSIREAYACGVGQLAIKNQWYEFIHQNWPNWWGQWNGTNGGSGWAGTFWNYQQWQSMALGQGRVPTYDMIRGPLRKVRAYAKTNLDFGKTITIFGVDNDNQPLQHRDPNTGQWEPGLVLTLQNPYAQTEGYVSRIDRVLKDVTQQPVSLYAYNTTDSVLEDLAIYDPGETDPSFAIYKLGIPCCQDEDGVAQSRSLTALVSMRYIPVQFDSDLIPLTMPAMKLLIMGIRAEESGDLDTAEGYIAKAVREMNHITQNRNPGKQISVNANSYGATIYSPV